MNDEIHVKVSGKAVYKAVKNYLDSSEELGNTIKELTSKHLENIIKNKMESILTRMDYEVQYKLKQELDKIVRKEVETKVAGYIATGIKKMFEG
jgi:ribosomal protein S17E